MNQDITILPPPKVRDSFSVAGSGAAASQLEYILQHGQVIADRYYTINKITPAYTRPDGTTGGYTPTQLRMEPPPDAKNIEPVVILIGDDGDAKECVQVSLELDRAFGYSMLVMEADRPRISLVSIALSLPAGSSQVSALGTFNDGTSYDVTAISLWRSTVTSVATIDVLGKVTDIAPGTTSIIASIGGIASPAFVHVVS